MTDKANANVWAEHFSGTPFQGMGNVLDAIYPEGAAKLMLLMPKFIAKGHIGGGSKDSGRGAALLQYPLNEAVKIGILLQENEESQSFEVIGMYPVLAGMLNRLKTLNYRAWDNGLEGMVVADPKNFGSVQFFDPYFFTDSCNLKKGENQVYELAALAMTAEVAKAEEIEISSGPLYEKSLAEFLEDNPDKTEKDFKNPVLNTGSLQMLIPTEYTGEYHFRALAYAREELAFIDQKLWRYQFIFSPDTADQSPELWLYVAQHNVQGRLPLIGEYIEGVLWMQGNLDRRE